RPSQQDHRPRHYQPANATPHPLLTDCRRRAIDFPRTTPQTTSSARGDDSPSLRRPWSSLAAPPGGYYKTQQDAVHIPGSFDVAPVTSLALQPPSLPTHQLRRRMHLGTSLLPHLSRTPVLSSTISWSLLSMLAGGGAGPSTSMAHKSDSRPSARPCHRERSATGAHRQ